MKRTIALAATIATIAGGSAVAASSAFSQKVVETLAAQGFSVIQVEEGIGTVKAEAVKGGVLVEVVYDARTGKIIRQRTKPLGSDDNGVQIASRDRSGAGGNLTGRVDDGNDHNDGSSDSGNDRSGSDSSGDNGSDHNGNDSNDGSSDNGSDNNDAGSDSGNDHNDGGSDNGSDHNDGGSDNGNDNNDGNDNH